MSDKRYVYGFVNCAAFNLRPEGDEHWLATSAARDEALRRFQAWAVSRGLSRWAASAGIYPVRRYVASESGAAWLDDLREGRAVPGIRWHGTETVM